MSEHENGTQGRKPDFVAYQVQETQEAKASGTGSEPLGGTRTGTGWN
jgi:hypothetical protein